MSHFHNTLIELRGNWLFYDNGSRPITCSTEGVRLGIKGFALA